jgi:hypothetical protein
MLPQRNESLPLPPVYPSSRELWHTHARYQKNSRSKSCNVAQ